MSVPAGWVVLQHYELALRRERGVAYVASKRHYFGVGGGTEEFRRAVASCPRAEGAPEVETAAEWEDGRSNVRDLLVLRTVVGGGDGRLSPPPLATCALIFLSSIGKSH